MIKSFKY